MEQDLFNSIQLHALTKLSFDNKDHLINKKITKKFLNEYYKKSCLIFNVKFEDFKKFKNQ